MDQLTNDDAEKVLRDAAAMARASMPALEVRIADLRQQLTNAERQLTRLQQLEHIGTDISPGRPRITHPLNLSSVKAPTTQEDIDDVLQTSVLPMSVMAIKIEILRRFGRDRAPATLYAYLGKGKKAGLYENTEDGWSLTDAGQASVSLV